MKMSHCWPKSKDIALIFCSKMTLKFVQFDYIFESDQSEPFLAKKQGYSLGILLKNDQI